MNDPKLIMYKYVIIYVCFRLKMILCFLARFRAFLGEKITKRCPNKAASKTRRNTCAILFPGVSFIYFLVKMSVTTLIAEASKPIISIQ